MRDFISSIFAYLDIFPLLAEIVELKKHPYFVAVQFHPEYKSTVLNPHPLFIRFVKAAVDYSLNVLK